MILDSNPGVAYLEGNEVDIVSLLTPNATVANSPKVINGNVRKQIILADPLTGAPLDLVAAIQAASTGASVAATMLLPSVSAGDDATIDATTMAAASLIGALLPTGQYVRVSGNPGETRSWSGLEIKSGVWLDNVVVKKNATSNGVLSNSILRTVDTATPLTGGAAITLTFTGVLTATATTATLTAPWAGTDYAPPVIFPNGDVRNVVLTPGSVAVSWVSGLSATAGLTNQAVVGTYYGKYANIKITNCSFDPNGHDCTAQILRFTNVEDLVIDNVQVRHSDTVTRWALAYGGNRIRINRFVVTNGTVRFQDGAHGMFGDDHQVTNCHIESGDDAFALGTDVTATGETTDDVALTNVVATGNVFKSTAATGVKIYYGLDTLTNEPFIGANRGRVDTVNISGCVITGGVSKNGAIFIQGTTLVSFTGALAGSATTGTLSTPFLGRTGAYRMFFDGGDMRIVGLTNGATTVTNPTTGSTSASFSAISASGATVTIVDPNNLKNIVINGAITAGSVANDAAAPYAIFIQGAANVRIGGTLTVIDTPNGSGFQLGNISALIGGHFTFDCPQVPRGAGLSFFNSRHIEVCSGRWVGCPTSRGCIEQTGTQDMDVHDMTFADLPTSGTAHIVQSVGSGDYANTAKIHHNSATKANGILIFATAPLATATSAVLNAPFKGATGNYQVTFSTSGDVRTVTLTNGSRAATAFSNINTGVSQPLAADSGITGAYVATLTRLYVQQSGNAGFVTWLSITDNDIRGQNNASAIDQAWNTAGTTPDYFYSNGNRGNIPNQNAMGTQTIAFNATHATPLLNGVGGHVNMPLTGNAVIGAPTGGVMGARIVYTFTQDSNGGRTVGWNAVFKFTAGAWLDGAGAGDANKVTRIAFELATDGNWYQEAVNHWVA